jgi:hypothetical protein
MRASISLPVALLLGFAPACSDDGDGTSGFSAGTTTNMPATTSSSGTDPTTGTASTTSTSEPDSSTTAAPPTSTTGTTSDDSTSTGVDPNCPPVKGEYNDCTDEQGGTDNKACKWMGDGENGFITCLNAAGIMGASTCSLVNCEMDCHCFDAPATGTATSVCRANATDKGDSACVLDCSGGATCPDGMVCDNDTCFWPAP